MKDNGKLKYQQNKLGIEPDYELIKIHNFVKRLEERDGKICQNCGLSKKSLYKKNEYLIPTLIGADQFHKHALKNRVLEFEKTKLFCRPCYNAY